MVGLMLLMKEVIFRLIFDGSDASLENKLVPKVLIKPDKELV